MRADFQTTESKSHLHSSSSSSSSAAVPRTDDAPAASIDDAPAASIDDAHVASIDDAPAASPDDAPVASLVSAQSMLDQSEAEEEEYERASLVKELNAFTTLVYGFVQDKSPAEQQLFALAFANLINSKNGVKGKPFSFSDHMGLQFK